MLFLLGSCGSLPYDNSPAPIDNGLWSLELIHEGQRDLGLMGSTFDIPGERFVEFPIWGKGVYSVRSKRCNLELSQEFKSNKLQYVKIKLKDLLKDMPPSEFACIFNIQVFVDGMDKGIQGQLFLVREEEDIDFVEVSILGKQYLGVSHLQIKDSANTNTEVLFSVRKRGTFFFQGCERRGEVKFSGSFKLPLSFIVGDTPKQCVYTFGFEFEDGTFGIHEFNFKTFRTTVVELPNPIITYEKEELKVEASDPVGYVSIDTKIRKGNTISKKVKKDELAWVRCVTSNGRYLLLGVRNGEVVWNPSILY